MNGHAMLINGVGLSTPEMLPLGWAWQVDGACSGSSCEGGGHEDVLAQHELGVFASSSRIVGEVEHKRSGERTTQLFSLLHQAHFVVSKLDVDVNELFEEKHCLFVIVDLGLGLRNI